MKDIFSDCTINLQLLAGDLDRAAVNADEIDQLTSHSAIDLDQAYEIQHLNIDFRLKRGERMVGAKMGFTSLAKMRQMGVDEMIWGRLTDGMAVANDGTISLSRYVHARVEPEVAFLLKRPLAGDVSREEALAAIEAVAPALEIIDSRYRNFKFSHVDVVADNCSSSGFVVGAWQVPRDLAKLGVVLEIDGEPVQSGSTSAILGDPLLSLIAAARLCGAGGAPLEAGWVVLAGAATEAVALRAGTRVRASVESLGDVAFSVAG